MKRTAVSKKQLKVNFSLEKPTGNFWIDNGIVMLYEQFGCGVHSVDEVLKQIVDKLLKPTGSKGQYYDEKSGRIVEYDKISWTYPFKYFVSISGKASKISIDELPLFIREQINKNKKDKADKNKEIFTGPPKFTIELKWSNKEDLCNICGTKSVTTKATKYLYPFVVNPNKFGNYYSCVKQEFKLCPRCALAGLASYLGLLTFKDSKVIHIFTFHSTLEELYRIHREVLGPLRQEQKSGKTPISFRGKYTYETVFGLLLKLFSYVKTPEDLTEDAYKLLASLFGADPENPPAPLSLYLITGREGKSFDIQSVFEFSNFSRLYKMYEDWLFIIESIAKNRHLAINKHEKLLHIWKQFVSKQGDKIETIWRDKIAKAILEFSDPLPYIQDFLFDVRAKEKNPSKLSIGTLSVMKHYLKTIYNMSEDIMRKLAGFGHSIGTAAKKQGDRGILYTLRNAQNIDDFLKALNQIQYRLSLTVPEKILEIIVNERISHTLWQRIKNLLCIYAMNSFLKKPKNSENPPEYKTV